MNKSIIFLIFIGLGLLLTRCKKDETKVVISSNIVAPTIKLIPDLTLKKDNANDTLVFVGTHVDPGFPAAAKYYLEIDSAGNQFQNPIPLFTSTVQDTAMKNSVGGINKLLKKYPVGRVLSLELRIRSVLIVDAGTGVEPIVSTSETKPVSVTTYAQ